MRTHTPTRTEAHTYTYKHTPTNTHLHTHTKLVSDADAPAPKWSIKNYANEFVFVGVAWMPGRQRQPVVLQLDSHRMRGN